MFKRENDRDMALRWGPTYIHRNFMFPIPWTKDYQIESVNQNICPIWKALPLLPLQF
eukprot:c51787_g1_i1 orf=47-217(+)